MRKRDRLKIITDQIYENGMVKVSDLSRQLDVHEETIRRDLKALSEKPDIEMIHGGAILKKISHLPSVGEIIIQTKRAENHDKKVIAARKAAELIQPGETIGLNSGSTVELITNYLADKVPLNLITLNVHIASKASTIPGIDVFMPAGLIRGKSGSVIGSDAVTFMKGFTLDKVFLGVSAISMSNGISHPNREEVEVNQAICQIAKKRYLVIDSSKVDKTAPFHMFDLEEIDGIITDDEFPDDYRAFMEMQNISVI